jgi:hypothetical protein
MRNVQQRVIDAEPEVVGSLLDRLSAADDPLWPAPAWDGIVLDGGLAPGSRGGHGPVRYTVAEYEPGRRVRFAFDPRIGLTGHHELRVEPAGPGRCLLVHDLVARTTGAMVLLWPLAVRALHTAVLQDLLDNAERAATGRVARPARHSGRVRAMCRLFEHRPVSTPVPADAKLLAAAMPDPDLADAYRVGRVGMPADPNAWADAVFRDPPGWVVALLRLRNLLVRLVGIPQGTPKAFDTLAVEGGELLLGQDDEHLDFRGSILVTETDVVLATHARVRNRRGRLYLRLVGVVHPMVVRSMLARAARRFADGPAAHALG